MQTYKKRVRKREYAATIILVISFFLLQIGINVLSRFKLTEYNGVLSALQYAVCLLMLVKNRKYTNFISIGLMTFTFINVSMAVIRGISGTLPGLFNAALYIVTLILIARFNYKRELENKTDMITGAYNRKGLYMELEDRIQKNKEFSIIYIYLDNFKAINDGYGHAYGDELLCKIMKRMNLRLGEECTIARLGGAEFVVIVNDSKNVKNIADRLLDTISEKAILVVDDNHVSCYASCYAGVSTFDKDASDYESLIKYADIAMTAAKEEKSKEAFLFNYSMLEKMNHQNAIENMIKEALAKKSFFLVYQPQYKVDQKKLRGFETLIRLRTPSGEVVNPSEFIPIAEKNDLILQIDNYVLMNAMLEFKQVVSVNPELIISVNVSAKDFASEWFIPKIQEMLKETEYPAKNLEIEITEYCMVNSMDITVNNINKLREMGIQIALDDFGTGYTALDYVSRLPIDLLKIDKSLIDDIEKDKKRRDFVHAVINMGQMMDCEVISEGVENDSQVSYLKDCGCDFIQGFVWGKPLKFDEIRDLI